MIRILGIDPGLNVTGWGIIEASGSNLHFCNAGVIKTDPKMPVSARLRHIHEGLVEVISLYKPTEVAIEETFVNKNALSSLKLGHARGAAILTSALANIDIYEYSATLIKKSVVGVGRAEKHQIIMMINYLLPNAKITVADSADALAVAICHQNHRKWYDQETKGHSRRIT